MTIAQTELTLDTFEKDLIPGSIKKLMASLKAEFVTNASPANKAEGAGGSSDLWKVPPQALKVMEGFNTRLAGPKLDAHIRDLADSMKAEGFYQDKPLSAIVLTDADGQDSLYVTDGHCRLKAALLAVSEGAEFKVIPVVTEDGRNTTLEDLTVKLYRSNTGKEMTPFEVGLICKRLSRAGWNDKMIADRLGIQPQYVDGLLRLVTAPKALRDAVTSDAMAASEAIKLIRKHGAAGALAELEQMKANAEAEAEAERAKNGGEAGEQKPVRITARHATGASMKKAVSKHGVDLYKAAKEVKNDPAYASLSEATRAKLDSLLAQLEKAEASDTTPAETQAEAPANPTAE
jgi:ParB-like chromosome segregation protein Spo0J